MYTHICTQIHVYVSTGWCTHLDLPKIPAPFMHWAQVVLFDSYSVVMLMFKLSNSFPTYTPGHHSIWSALSSAPSLGCPQGLHRPLLCKLPSYGWWWGRVEAPWKIIWETSRSLVFGEELQASECEKNFWTAPLFGQNLSFILSVTFIHVDDNLYTYIFIRC